MAAVAVGDMVNRQVVVVVVVGMANAETCKASHSKYLSSSCTS